MWEAGSKLQLRTLACGSCDVLLQQAATLQSMRTGLTELDFTIKTVRLAAWVMHASVAMTSTAATTMRQQQRRCR